MLAIHLALLVLNYQMQPCCIRSVNRWRSASFAGSSWVGMVVMVHLFYNSGAVSELRAPILTLLCVGWGCIFLVTLLVQVKANRRPARELNGCGRFLQHMKQRRTLSGVRSTHSFTCIMHHAWQGHCFAWTACRV